MSHCPVAMPRSFPYRSVISSPSRAQHQSVLVPLVDSRLAEWIDQKTSSFSVQLPLHWAIQRDGLGRDKPQIIEPKMRTHWAIHYTTEATIKRSGSDLLCGQTHVPQDVVYMFCSIHRIPIPGLAHLSSRRKMSVEDYGRR
jgi:hypothetical protein